MNSPDVSRLLSLLKNLEESECEPVEAFRGDEACIQDILFLADTVLVTKSGTCNWAAHQVLQAHGYDVFCAERDSFGWLVGGIQTKKGVIYYG